MQERLAWLASTQAKLARRSQLGLADRLDLLSTLSKLYSGLGLDEKSAELAQRQLELVRRTLKPNDLRLATALVDYANAIYATSRAKDSLSVLEEAVRILDANGDQTSILRAEADNALSAYWRTVGRDLAKARSGTATPILAVKIRDFAARRASQSREELVSGPHTTDTTAKRITHVSKERAKETGHYPLYPLGYPRQ